MIKKLRGIDFRLRDLCMKLYLNKWRTEHNVAFFEWRRNFKEEAKELIEKYSQKLQRCIEQEDNMLEDKNDFNNELLGINLNQEHNDSVSSINVSMASIAPVKQNKKKNMYSKALTNGRKSSLKKKSKKTEVESIPILDRYDSDS